MFACLTLFPTHGLPLADARTKEREGMARRWTADSVAEGDERDGVRERERKDARERERSVGKRSQGCEDGWIIWLIVVRLSSVRFTSLLP